jgi:hypothetical protein
MSGQDQEGDGGKIETFRGQAEQGVELLIPDGFQKPVAFHGLEPRRFPQQRVPTEVGPFQGGLGRAPVSGSVIWQRKISRGDK